MEEKKITEKQKKELLKAKKSYIVVNHYPSYNNHLVLPYKAGVELIAAMEGAEILEDTYGQTSKIKPISSANNSSSEKLSWRVMAEEEYLQLKMNTVLFPDTE